MQIRITGRGVELTPAIEEYVNKKISGLSKFFADIVRVDVVVGMETRHHAKGDIFYAEGKIEIPKNDVFVNQKAESLYAAIDALRDGLESELKKFKVKLQKDTKKNKTVLRSTKEYRQ